MNLRAGVLACALAPAAWVPTPASAQSLSEDAARGVHDRGLRAAESGPCAGGFEYLEGSTAHLVADLAGWFGAPS